MSNAETTKDLVGQSIGEIKRGIDTLADSTKAPLEAESLEVQQNIQHALDQVKDAVSVALDCFTQCSSVDQLRGYAN